MRMFRGVCRVALLVFSSVLATSALMYCAPGYFSDLKEMDAAHAASARADLTQKKEQQSSLPKLLASEIAGWARGDLGQSRQFGTPVSELVRDRASRSAALLLEGVSVGWSAALLLAIPFSMRRGAVTDVTLAAITAALLAVPVGAMATISLIANCNQPVLILALVVAVRDVKLLHRMLRSIWQASYIVHARAQGLSSFQILRAHLLPTLRRELLSIGVMSFTLALSALVPVEVIFDAAGLGQLAWNGAMNRDLPVLAAVTAIVACCVGVATLALGPTRTTEEAPCA